MAEKNERKKAKPTESSDNVFGNTLQKYVQSDFSLEILKILGASQ